MIDQMPESFFERTVSSPDRFLISSPIMLGSLNARILVVVSGGGNHGQSLAFPPNSCVNGYLDRYLATGALPAKPGLVNATCPALPSPSA